MELAELEVKKELTKTEIKVEFEETKWPIEKYYYYYLLFVTYV